MRTRRTDACPRPALAVCVGSGCFCCGVCFFLASSPGPGGELLTGHAAPASRRGRVPRGLGVSGGVSPRQRPLGPLPHCLGLCLRRLSSPGLPFAPCPCRVTGAWRASRVAGAGCTVRRGAAACLLGRAAPADARPSRGIGGPAHGGSAFPVWRHQLYCDYFPVNYIDCDSVQFILFSTSQQIAKFCFCFCSFGQSLLPLLVRRRPRREARARVPLGRPPDFSQAGGTRGSLFTGRHVCHLRTRTETNVVCVSWHLL